VTDETKKPTPSSAKLKTDVANFMARADKVLAHRLAEQPPSLQVLFNLDPETTIVTSINVDWNHIDEESWVYLAVLMRPIIFNEQDPISFNKLSGAIAHEHELLRTLLKEGRKRFSAWQKHMYVGQQEMGPVAQEHKGLPSGTVTRFEFGEPDTVPDDVDLDQVVPDYKLADIYLNGLVWHSDTAKAAEFQAATPYSQAFYAKCAEIRTITGIKYVRDLREFVIRTRALGFDF
jgi:hypothetical protein